MSYMPFYNPVTDEATCLGHKTAEVCLRCARKVKKADGKSFLNPPATSDKACRYRKLKARS